MPEWLNFSQGNKRTIDENKFALSPPRCEILEQTQSSSDIIVKYPVLCRSLRGEVIAQQHYAAISGAAATLIGALVFRPALAALLVEMTANATGPPMLTTITFYGVTELAL